MSLQDPLSLLSPCDPANCREESQEASGRSIMLTLSLASTAALSLVSAVSGIAYDSLPSSIFSPVDQVGGHRTYVSSREKSAIKVKYLSLSLSLLCVCHRKLGIKRCLIVKPIKMEVLWSLSLMFLSLFRSNYLSHSLQNPPKDANDALRMENGEDLIIEMLSKVRTCPQLSDCCVLHRQSVLVTIRSVAILIWEMKWSTLS